MVWKDRKYRILLTGCSFTYGVGVPQTSTFAWHLQSLLPDCLIDDVGVPGAGAVLSTYFEYMILNREHYDLVLYMTIGNHLSREYDVGVSWEPFDAGAPLKAVPYEWFCFPDVANKLLYRIFNTDFYWPGEEKFRCINFLRMVNLDLHWRWHIMRNRHYDIDRMTALLRIQRKIAEDHGCKFYPVNLYGYSAKAIAEIENQRLCKGDTTPPIQFLDVSYPVDFIEAHLNTEPGDCDSGDHPIAVVHHYYAHRLLTELKDKHILPEAAFQNVPPQALLSKATQQ